MERAPVKSSLTYSVSNNPNPVTEFRLRQLDSSIEKTARMIGVSVSTLLRTEYGCYNNLPPTILRYLSNYSGTPDSISNMYARFQTHKRIASSREHELDYFYWSKLQELCAKEPEVNPFVLWREGLQKFNSRLAFCKAFCLHPSTIKRLEDGFAEKLPAALKIACDDIGLDYMRLEEEYIAWRRRYWNNKI